MKTVHDVLDIAAPPSRVCTALTESDRLANWSSMPQAAAGVLRRYRGVELNQGRLGLQTVAT